jgi:hypothetical protein
MPALVARTCDCCRVWVKAETTPEHPLDTAMKRADGAWHPTAFVTSHTGPPRIFARARASSSSFGTKTLKLVCQLWPRRHQEEIGTWSKTVRLTPSDIMAFEEKLQRQMTHGVVCMNDTVFVINALVSCSNTFSKSIPRASHESSLGFHCRS